MQLFYSNVYQQT